MHKGLRAERGAGNDHQKARRSSYRPYSHQSVNRSPQTQTACNPKTTTKALWLEENHWRLEVAKQLGLEPPAVCLKDRAGEGHHAKRDYTKQKRVHDQNGIPQ